jgi:hypothetical protein
MSKKKNTLKDLDEFLKQQAATLVTPSRLNESPEQTVKEEPLPTSPETRQPSLAQILQDLKALSKNEEGEFRSQFLNLIIETLEAQRQSLPEDKMLINTVLYLKNQNNWKEAIRHYWKNKT